MSDQSNLYGEISQDKLYMKVADKIQHLIVGRTLSPADKLPPERELASLFGVSRTVVREAVKVLRERIHPVIRQPIFYSKGLVRATVIIR